MKLSVIFVSMLGMSLSFAVRAQNNETTSKTDKEQRKLALSEKRAFDPKSSFIELNAGRFFTQTKEVGGEDFFENQLGATMVTHLSFEKGLSHFYYLKGSASYANYLMKVRVNEANGAGVFFPFNAFGLSVGLGKRVMLRNNFNLLNVEAGIGMNAHTAKKGLTNESFGAGRFTDTGDTLYMYNSKSYIDAKFFPTLYLGASKDFQLAKAFYLSVAYRFNLGLTSVAHQDLFYSDVQNSDTPTKLVVNGTSHAVTLGLKYRFGK